MSIVDTASAIPHGRLAGLASRYVGYRLEGFESGTHLGLPSRSVVVVISLGTPIRRTIDGRSADHAAFAAGLDTRPAVISHDGNQYGVLIDLTPAGVRSLLGVPAAALAGTTAELDQLLGRHTGELVERMATTPTWAQRFDILDEALGRRVERLAPARDYLDHAWHRIVTSAGAARIGDLATDIGFSGRYLRRRFAAEFGLPPKSAARIVRFERSRWMLQSPARPSLATVAATCGYYDQAHLARDWNELAGCPPSAWLTADSFTRSSPPSPPGTPHPCDQGPGRRRAAGLALAANASTPPRTASRRSTHSASSPNSTKPGNPSTTVAALP